MPASPARPPRSGSSEAPEPKEAPTDWSAWQVALPAITPPPLRCPASPMRSSKPVPAAVPALTPSRITVAAPVVPAAPVTKVGLAATPAALVPRALAVAVAPLRSWPSSAERSSAVAAAVARVAITSPTIMRRRGRVPPLRSVPVTPVKSVVSVARLSGTAAAPAAAAAVSSADVAASASTATAVRPRVAAVSPARAAPWASRSAASLRPLSPRILRTRAGRLPRRVGMASFCSPASSSLLRRRVISSSLPRSTGRSP